MHNQLRTAFFALLLISLFQFSNRSAQSQTDSFLNQFQGSWRGEGKAFGMKAQLQLKWEWVLGDKFLRLTVENKMTAANSQTQIFAGHAYYQSVGGTKYSGRWFDSRGETFPIQAQAEGDALIALWGTAEQEQGKSIYRRMEANKLEVVDFVLQKDGTWKEFGRFVVTRE